MGFEGCRLPWEVSDLLIFRWHTPGHAKSHHPPDNTKVVFIALRQDRYLTCMGPVRYAMTDEDVVALSTQVLKLFQQALPDPGDRSLFDRLMAEARYKGLTWFEGLEYTAQQRRAHCGW